MSGSGTKKSGCSSSIFWIGFILYSVFMTFYKGGFDDYELDEYVENIDETNNVNMDSIRKVIQEKERLRREEERKKILAMNCEVIKKNFSWEDLHGNEFEIDFMLCQESYENATAVREASDSWGRQLYKTMHTNDTVGLKNLFDAFADLKVRRKLNKGRLLEAVVTFIQSIPYTYILPPGRFCGTGTLPDEFCGPREKPAGCCNDVIPWGVLSPLEFVVTEAGDCDTRTLLGLTILKHFGYDVAILNSDKMAHSMLGVYVPFIPGNGHYGTDYYGRKKYYLWETTAKGFHLGDNFEFYSDDWIVEYN